VLFRAVFAAILRSVRSSNWKAPWQRYLVHIGDLADRRIQPPPRLLDALSKHRITYLPIALIPSSDETDGHRFFDQAETILFRYWPAIASTHQFSEVGVIDNPGKDGTPTRGETGVILSRLLQRITANGSQAAIRIRTDAIRRQIDRLALVATRLVTNPAVASESSNRSPLVSFRGRVATRNRTTGKTYWERLALVAESELPILAGIMETLCHACQDKIAAAGTGRRVSQLLGAVSGDQIKETTAPYDYLERVLGLPFPEQTLLRRSLTEIEEYLVRLTDPTESPFVKGSVGPRRCSGWCVADNGPTRIRRCAGPEWLGMFRTHNPLIGSSAWRTSLA